MKKRWRNDKDSLKIDLYDEILERRTVTSNNIEHPETHNENQHEADEKPKETSVEWIYHNIFIV